MKRTNWEVISTDTEIWEAFEEAGLDVEEALYHHRMVFHGGY